MPFVLLLLLMGLLPACDRADAPDPSAASPDPDPARPPAGYGRRMLFLAGSDAAPVAVVFDFATVDSPGAARHGVGTWRAGARGWDSVLADRWTDAPIREPWRLVPHGAFRLVVDDAGDVEALVHRATAGAFHLRPGALLGEWSPGEAAQYWLRSAELELADARHAGVLLDVQTGALDPTGPGTGAAFLTDGDALRLVIALEAAGPTPAWLQRGDSAEVWEEVSLRPDSAAAGRGTVWRLAAPGGTLRAEIRALGPALTLDPVDGASFDSAAVHSVGGWVEVRGARRPVFGLLRHGPA